MNFYIGSVFMVISILEFVPVELNSHHHHERSFGKYWTHKHKSATGPININSKETTYEPSKPLKAQAVLSQKVKLINTGKAVEFIAEERNDESEITSGVLGDDEYVFEKVRFYWTNNIHEKAATSVDGEGAPLEIIGYFYNKKHHSFQNATHKENGVAELSYRMRIQGKKDNKKFDLFAQKLKKIRQAGTTVEANVGEAIMWYNFIYPDAEYFAYPGEYTDLETNKKYLCTTTIILPMNEKMFLSERQFRETFLSLRNRENGPLVNKESQISNSQIPIKRSKKVINKAIPFDKNSMQSSQKWQQEEEFNESNDWKKSQQKNQ